MINRFKIEFSDRGRERTFRDSYLEKDAVQGIIAFALCIIPLLLFSVSDFLLFGLSAGFFKLTALRVLFLILLLGMILFLKFNRNYILNDAVIFCFWLLTTAGIFYIYSTRPREFTPYSVFDILVILSVYLVLPNRFILQLIPALLYSASITVFLLGFSNGTDAVIEIRIILSLFLANLIGIFISWRLHFLRRIEFMALLKEKELRGELEEALRNVKTLSGLLPICSSCHKIRNDEGYWKSIDRYIEEHSDAQFTHSICSDCAEKLYGGEKWFNRKRDK